jgi:hypothetical protein
VLQFCAPCFGGWRVFPCASDEVPPSEILHCDVIRDCLASRTFASLLNTSRFFFRLQNFNNQVALITHVRRRRKPKNTAFCASLLLPRAFARHQRTLLRVTICLHSVDLHVHQNPRCQCMPILLLSPIIIKDDDPPVIVCSIAPSTQLTTNFRRYFRRFLSLQLPCS